MKVRFVYFCFLLCLCAVSQAEEYVPKDVSEIRAQYALLQGLQQAGEISADTFKQRSQALIVLAEKEHHIKLEENELAQITSIERFDWLGSTLYVLSAILVLVLLGPLVKKLARPFMRYLHVLIYFFRNNQLIRYLARKLLAFIEWSWEFFAYLILASALYFFGHEYVVLLVSFLLGTLVSFSVFFRISELRREHFSKITAFILTILWGGIAVYFDNELVGFMAVAAFVTSIGFIIVFSPRTIGIGFSECSEGYILSLTRFTFVLTLITWFLFYTDYIPALAPVKEIMRVFRVGMTSLIPLTYFVGLGYLSFVVRHSSKTTAIIRELVSLVSGISILIISLLYNIQNMFWIGLFFMAWDLLDKYYTYIYRRMEFVWAGLILAIFLGVSGYLLKANIDTVMNVLRPLGL